MIKLSLKRFMTSAEGTLGTLIDEDNKKFICLTLERPWEDNKEDVSCVYDFSYSCYRVKSDKFGETFKLADLEGRSGILFHKGNFITDTKGCILTGFGYGRIHDQFAILRSGEAFEKFMEYLKGEEEFWLEVEWVYPKWSNL